MLSVAKMGSLKISLFPLVLWAAIGFIGTDAKPPSAVLGGEDADPNEFPYQVSMSLYSQHFCGGTIIDKTHVLTAAHCCDDDPLTLKNVRINTGTNYAGVGTGRAYRIRNVTIHPEYSTLESESWKNDIAVITLTEEIKYDRRHQPVKLPKSSTLANTKVIACGWGVTSYPNGNSPIGLKKVSMKVVSNSRCLLPGKGIIYGTHICAISKRGAGVCSGDSGGPLLENDTIVGVASFVIPCGKGYPDVFTRVYNYVDWIEKVIEES